MSARRFCLRASLDESGASLVEFALILPVFMMLILGMFTGGLAYNRKQAVTQAGREAARYGATLPTSGLTPVQWLDQVESIVESSADGELGSNATGRSVCIALVSGGAVSSRQLTGLAVSYGTTTCFNDGRPLTEARVQVVASRTSNFEALLFSRNLTLQTQAVSRFEAS